MSVTRGSTVNLRGWPLIFSVIETAAGPTTLPRGGLSCDSAVAGTPASTPAVVIATPVPPTSFTKSRRPKSRFGDSGGSAAYLGSSFPRFLGSGSLGIFPPPKLQMAHLRGNSVNTLLFRGAYSTGQEIYNLVTQISLTKHPAS